LPDHVARAAPSLHHPGAAAACQAYAAIFPEGGGICFHIFLVLIDIEYIDTRNPVTFRRLLHDVLPQMPSTAMLPRKAVRQCRSGSGNDCQNILPGFRMLPGSRAALIMRMAAISSAVREWSRKVFFARPMPCSAEIDPP